MLDILRLRKNKKQNLILFQILTWLVFLNLTHVFYFNIFTHSLPHGIYMKIQGKPQRGDYAASCLTDEIARYGMDQRYLEQGNCDTGTVRILKIVKGLPGDHFVIKNGFLQLNGYAYPIMNKDSSGRTLKSFYKQKEGVLDKGQYILLSDYVNNSWDSRYWGPVGIQFLLKPFCLFDNVKK